MTNNKQRAGCLGCTHLFIDFGDHGYSEWTPGGVGEVSCRKSIFNALEDATLLGTKECYDLLQIGNTCKEFKWHYLLDGDN